MPTLLHVTDTHLGVGGWYRGAPPGWTRADDHIRALRIALAPARRGEVDGVIHSGDLFDRSEPPPAAVAAARDLLAEVGRRVPVVVIPGNHDRRGIAGTVGGLSGVTVCDTPAVVTLAGVKLALLPWLPEAQAWVDSATRLADAGADLWVCHAAFAGARVPGFTFKEGYPKETLGARAIPRGVKHVLCGHIHHRQVLRLGDAHVVMAGSAERTSLVERDDTKGVVHWELEREIVWSFRDLPSRPMRRVDHEDDLDRVGTEQLVHLGPEARTPEMEAEVLRRGAWVHPWKPPRTQTSLFRRA